MHQQFEVVYENGVLRPLGRLPAKLRDRHHYTVTIAKADDSRASLDAACVEATTREADPHARLEDVRAALAKLPGTLASAVAAEREEG